MKGKRILSDVSVLGVTLLFCVVGFPVYADPVSLTPDNLTVVVPEGTSFSVNYTLTNNVAGSFLSPGLLTFTNVGSGDSTDLPSSTSVTGGLGPQACRVQDIPLAGGASCAIVSISANTDTDSGETDMDFGLISIGLTEAVTLFDASGAFVGTLQATAPTVKVYVIDPGATIPGVITPEPSGSLLLGIVAAGIACIAWKRRREYSR